MQEVGNTLNCLNCGRPESAVPLVALRYAGDEAWICSMCLPLLIHHPERLAGKLSAAAITPVPPHEQEDV